MEASLAFPNGLTLPLMSEFLDYAEGDVEKRHGYRYEHLFSLNWNAMKGYHDLIHLGHALNVLAHYSEELYTTVVSKGVGAFIKYVRDSLVHPWLDPDRLYKRLRPNPQLRLT